MFQSCHPRILLAVISALAPAGVSAQHHGQHPPANASAVAPAVSEPQGVFAVRSFGAFRNMMQKQDYTAKIVLGEVKGLGATEAVGALSSLRGEITMIDGRFIVSYGGGCANCPPPHAEDATLLGAGRVAEWTPPISLSADLSGRALDEFILAQAKSIGLDMGKPFPVRLKGMLLNVEMHVIEAPNAGFTGHGSKVHMAKQDEYRHGSLAGEVVGFYAPSAMQGVLSHPGEPFHFHWVDEQRTRTAHLDAFGMQSGALLMLPKK